MTTTDTDLTNLVINKLTKTQYDGITPSQDEFYYITDGKISADEITDTNTTNKFVTASDKLTWNGKQDALVSGSNIKNVCNYSLVGEGNVSLSASDVGALSSSTTISDLTTQTQLDAMNSGANSTNIGQIATNQSNITSIQSLIPAQASINNKLTDKSYVDTSISTATATFRGTFTSLASLQAAFGDRNDYAFYEHTDSDGNTLYDRYKYVGVQESRVPTEYTERLSVNVIATTTAYFKTGVKFNSTDRLYSKMNSLSHSYAESFIFGAKDSSNNYIQLAKSYDWVNHAIQTNNGNSTATFNSTCVLEIKDNKVYKDDVLVSNVTMPSVDAELYLFALNDVPNDRVLVGQNIVQQCDFIIYDNNGNKKLELIPCTRNNDSVNGFYDTVSQQFLEPQGGGTPGKTDLSTDAWVYEYTLSNISFTSAQWTTINSGVTSNISSLTNNVGYITGITSTDVTTALGYTPLSSLNQSVTALSGTSITLMDNSINTLTPTGNTTFTLPTVTDTTIFHQILVQLDLSTVYTIDLGTTSYFGGTAPDLSNAGNYNLIYEYDNAMQEWVVGAVNKA